MHIFQGHICVRFIATFNRYTGDKGATRADRGSRLAQALCLSSGLCPDSVRALARGTIFHIHFSGRGSLLRRGHLRDASHPAMPVLSAFAYGRYRSLFPRGYPWPAGGRSYGVFVARTRVIVLTRFWHDYYSSILNLPPERVLLLPNPADLPKSIPDRSRRTGPEGSVFGQISGSGKERTI